MQLLVGSCNQMSLVRLRASLGKFRASVSEFVGWGLWSNVDPTQLDPSM